MQIENLRQITSIPFLMRAMILEVLEKNSILKTLFCKPLLLTFSNSVEPQIKLSYQLLFSEPKRTSRKRETDFDDLKERRQVSGGLIPVGEPVIVGPLGNLTERGLNSSPS